MAECRRCHQQRSMNRPELQRNSLCARCMSEIIAEHSQEQWGVTRAPRKHPLFECRRCNKPKAAIAGEANIRYQLCRSCWDISGVEGTREQFNAPPRVTVKQNLTSNIRKLNRYNELRTQGLSKREIISAMGLTEGQLGYLLESMQKKGFKVQRVPENLLKSLKFIEDSPFKPNQVPHGGGNSGRSSGGMRCICAPCREKYKAWNRAKYKLKKAREAGLGE